MRHHRVCPTPSRSGLVRHPYHIPGPHSRPICCWRFGLSLDRYHFERSSYSDAEIKIQGALGVYELAQGKSPLHHASLHRVHAAIALERGKSDEAAQYVHLQMEQLQLRWLQQGEDLRQSGLLDRAPDAVALSPWGLDVPPGKLAVLPFRSVCSFGWKLYLSAKNGKDPRYLKYLNQAALCFLTALEDRKGVVDESEQGNPRWGLPHSTSELAKRLANAQQDRRAAICPG